MSFAYPVLIPQLDVSSGGSDAGRMGLLLAQSGDGALFALLQLQSPLHSANSESSDANERA